MKNNPTHKVVLITGASRGIGLATAKRLIDDGYIVYGTSRNPENLSELGFPLLPLDVTDDKSVKNCVETIIAQSGQLDVLINNAGLSIFGAVEENSIEEAKNLFETNFFGVMRMVNAVLPIMRQQRCGLIINISSIGGLLGLPYMGIYASSKFAIEGYSESLRHEVKALGIDVTVIEPGDINTDIVEPHTQMRIDDYAKTRDYVYQDHMKSMNSAPPPEIVANLIAKVIKRQKPRLRYSVGRESFAPIGRRLLPMGLAEWVVRRYFRLDR